MKLLDRLRQRFRHPKYRRTYADSFTDSFLATQIKVLREQRGFTQEQLADLVGVKQSQICRWENVDNSSWQVRSLKNIAGALDLALVVKFESYGNILSAIESFGRSALQRPSFADDPVFSAAHVVATVDVSPDGEYPSTAPTVQTSVELSQNTPTTFAIEELQQRVA